MTDRQDYVVGLTVHLRAFNRNRTQLFTLFALGNLFLVRGWLMA